MTQLVRHVTGGPLMAVVKDEGGFFTCRWFNMGELAEGEFSRDELLAVGLSAVPEATAPKPPRVVDFKKRPNTQGFME